MSLDAEEAEQTGRKSKQAINTSAIRTATDETLQEELARTNPNWPSLIQHGMKCPCCDHGVLVPTRPIAEIEKECKEICAEYDRKVRNGKKPKMPVYPKIAYMCMCRVNTCHDIETGKGCIKCKERAKLGLPSLFDGVKRAMLCDHCQCKCEITFLKKNGSTSTTSTMAITGRKNVSASKQPKDVVSHCICFLMQCLIALTFFCSRQAMSVRC